MSGNAVGEDVQPGEVVAISRRWGNQVRQKCIACTKFFNGNVCRHCGVEYAPLPDGTHRVVSVP